MSVYFELFQEPSNTKLLDTDDGHTHSSNALSPQNPYSPDPSQLMGAYIDVTKVRGRGTVERRVQPQSLPTHLGGFGGFGEEEGGEVGLMAARTVQLGMTLEEQEEEERPHPRAENQYLTIIRDDSDRDLSEPLPPPGSSNKPPPVAAKPANMSRRPAVPVHKKRLVRVCWSVATTG